MVTLCDSGILIRLFEPNEPLHPAIHDAVAQLIRRGDKLVTSVQNIAEFWNVCTRPMTARGGLGLSIADTESRLQRIETSMAILQEPSTVYKLWRDLVTTLAIQGKQVHDARIAAVMDAHGITQILTLNGSDFKRFPAFTVLDPVSMSATS
jgi:predicted nucleic acid-binding protein